MIHSHVANLELLEEHGHVGTHAKSCNVFVSKIDMRPLQSEKERERKTSSIPAPCAVLRKTILLLSSLFG